MNNELQGWLMIYQADRSILYGLIELLTNKKIIKYSEYEQLVLQARDTLIAYHGKKEKGK